MTAIDLTTITHALVSVDGTTVQVELSDADRKKLAAVHASADSSAHERIEKIKALEEQLKQAREAAGIVDDETPRVTAKPVKATEKKADKPKTTRKRLWHRYGIEDVKTINEWAEKNGHEVKGSPSNDVVTAYAKAHNLTLDA
ncbi:hypothetical protein AB0J38_23455 [Streptomyces sp. NPDC050095]|uniref:hypothetical protein n=1 Tax=unclassified Streptomyces TaxID=2593676 RepID=UPI0034433AF5